MRSGVGQRRFAGEQRSIKPGNALFDAVCVRLPLFDGLPEGAVERLEAGGLGRGLLTATLRARLRRAGFGDMGALALATPADLLAVRKIGPVRVDAIRGHVLAELARRHPDARAAHSEDATARRRMDRLRATPAERLLPGPATVAGLGGALGTCADLARMHYADIPATVIDGVVAALAKRLSPAGPYARAIATEPETDAAQDEKARRDLRREQDREWEAAAPDA